MADSVKKWRGAPAFASAAWAAVCATVCASLVACSEPVPQGPTERDASSPLTARHDTEAADIAPADDQPSGQETPPLPSGAEALILAVTPGKGPSGGLTEVEIAGVGLSGAVAVFFGESPALELEVLDDNTLRVLTPPRPPGLVDVTARLGDALPGAGVGPTEVTLPLAFRYVAEVRIADLSPTKGPIDGGTLVTIRGGGFDDATHFVFGDRLAIDPLILDENTAAVHSPPGLPGRVAVMAANPDGSAVLPGAFTYWAKPRIDLVAPATAALDGGGEITLHGVGLLAAGGVVRVRGPNQGGTSEDYKAQLLAADPHGVWLKAKVPPVAAGGVYEVRYLGLHGEADLADSLTYIGPAPAGNAITAVAPSQGPGNLPTQVAITVVGPIAGSAKGSIQVSIDGAACALLDHDVGPGHSAATLRVVAPPAGAGPLPRSVTTRVQVGGAVASAKNTFTYLPLKPRILSAIPDTLDASGGTKVRLRVSPAATSLGAVAGVRVGALYATKVSWQYDAAEDLGIIDLNAPKGSPGPADIDVVFDKGILHAPHLVQFAGVEPILGALSPARGSQAGGTIVRLIGQGLDRAHRIFLGGRQVQHWKLIHPGLIELRTPRGEPGPAALEVWFTDGLPKRRLDNAFVYFDPVAGNYGTWGPPIDGAVNVTVLRSNMGAGPLEGATVVIGTDPHTPYRGKTDDRGQITFSAKGLRGPLTVSATRTGYTAASVVAANSENITLRLRKHPVPSSGKGGGKGDDAFPDGAIDGRVLNAAKYMQLPMGNCEATPITSGNCAPCDHDGQCTGTETCELLVDPLSGFNTGDAGVEPPAEPTEPAAAATLTAKPAQRYCAATCTANTDCPGGFTCRAISWSPGNTKYRCTPSIGKAEIRCETSSPSIYGGNPSPGPDASVDKDFGFHINSRPGDLAVICRAGYIAKGSGEFVALMMGVAPHVHVAAGQTTKGVEVLLSVPLSRRIRVRLDRLPMGPDAGSHRRELNAAIDLDPEGYIPMGEVSITHATDVLVLERQPSAFTGALQGKSYTIFAGLRELKGGAPVSLAMAENLHPEHSDHIAFWGKGEKGPSRSPAMTGPINDIVTDPANIYAVGDRGYIGVWSGAAFTQQASPTARDLHGVWARGDGHEAWAVGDSGTVLRRGGPGWQALPTVTSGDLIDVTGASVASGKPPAVWLLRADNRLLRRAGQGWLEVDGPLPALMPKSAWYKLDADRVRTILLADDGSLLAAGDSGGLWRAEPSDSTGKLAWQTLPTPTHYTLRALWGSSGKDFFAVGDRGYFARFFQGKLTPIPSVTDRPLYAVAGLSDGVHAVGGMGAWVQLTAAGKLVDRTPEDVSVDLRGIAETSAGKLAAGQPILVIGPYLEMPYFDDPAPTEPLGNRIRWHSAPGVTPTLNLLRITNYSYKTMWEIYARGTLSSVELPDFAAFGELSPIPGGQLRVRLWRIYAPGLQIDHFNHKQLSIWRWVSYAYNWTLTEQHHMLGAPQPPSPLPATPPRFPRDFSP